MCDGLALKLLALDLMETSDESDDEDEMMMLHHMMSQRRQRIPKIRHGVNSIPELELMGNSNSGIGIVCLKK